MIFQEESEADRVLMRHLIALHEAHDKKHDVTSRGKLANLRYGMRDRLHDPYPVGRVFPALKEGSLTDNDERNEWRTLIASLYGYSHDDIEDIKGITLGSALRTLADKRDSDSLERRFMAMLNTDAEHLPGYLRQSLSLLKAEQIGLDWGTLLNDVAFWQHSEKKIQKKWVRDYYKSRKLDANDPLAPEEKPDETGNLFDVTDEN